MGASGFGAQRNEPFVYRPLEGFGSVVLVPPVDGDGSPHDGTGEEGGAETLRSLVLFGEVDFRFADALCLFGCPERHDHDAPGYEQQQVVGHYRFAELAHHHAVVASGRKGYLVGVEAGYRYADEVHQVVAREGERQREGAGEYRNLEDVDFGELKQEHDKRADREETEQDGEHVGRERIEKGRTEYPGILQPLEESEVGDGGEGDAAPQGAEALQHLLVAESEDETADEHHEGTHHEGDGHGGQDTRYDDESLARVDVIGHVGRRQRRVGAYLERGDRHRGAEQSENEGDGRGGGQSEGVEQVEQYHVGEHHPEKEHHYVAEGEHLRVEHAAAGHLHHAAGGHRTQQDADRSDGKDDFAGGGFGAYRRVEEVDCVIGNPYDETEDCQNQ